MAENDITEKATAAYIPLATLVNFIAKVKATVLPPVIDSSLTQNLSGGMSGALMTALKFLNLIDKNGKVYPALKQLVDAYQTEQWKPAFGQVITAAYSPLIGDLDIATATPKLLDDKFRKIGMEGQMAEKAVRFYLGALKEAGEPISPHFKIRKSTGSNAKRKTSRRPARRSSVQDEDDDDFDSDDPDMVRFQIPIPGKLSATVAVPKNLTAEDWDMLTAMLNAYIKRLQGQNQ